MTDATFTNCILVILRQVDRYCQEPTGEEDQFGPPPDWYQDNPDSLTVVRSMHGFRAQIRDYDQCSCCPETVLFATEWCATEQAALMRLGTIVREAQENLAAKYEDRMCEAIGRCREAIAGA